MRPRIPNYSFHTQDSKVPKLVHLGSVFNSTVMCKQCAFSMYSEITLQFGAVHWDLGYWCVMWSLPKTLGAVMSDMA